MVIGILLGLVVCTLSCYHSLYQLIGASAEEHSGTVAAIWNSIPLAITADIELLSLDCCMMSAVTALVIQVNFLCLQANCTSVLIFFLTAVIMFIGTLGFGSLYNIMLPFALDQMIGASAEELSAAVQWYYWGMHIPLAISKALDCVSIPDQFRSLDILSVVLLTLGSLSLSAALIMDCLYHKWLDTHNKTGNPIKLLLEVLNYT